MFRRSISWKYCAPQIASRWAVLLRSAQRSKERTSSDDGQGISGLVDDALGTKDVDVLVAAALSDKQPAAASDSTATETELFQQLLKATQFANVEASNTVFYKAFRTPPHTDTAMLSDGGNDLIQTLSLSHGVVPFTTKLGLLKKRKALTGCTVLEQAVRCRHGNNGAACVLLLREALRVAADEKLPSDEATGDEEGEEDADEEHAVEAQSSSHNVSSASSQRGDAFVQDAIHALGNRSLAGGQNALAVLGGLYALVARSSSQSAATEAVLKLLLPNEATRHQQQQLFTGLSLEERVYAIAWVLLVDNSAASSYAACCSSTEQLLHEMLQEKGARFAMCGPNGTKAVCDALCALVDASADSMGEEAAENTRDTLRCLSASIRLHAVLLAGTPAAAARDHASFVETHTSELETLLSHIRGVDALPTKRLLLLPVYNMLQREDHLAAVEALQRCVAQVIRWPKDEADDLRCVHVRLIQVLCDDVRRVRADSSAGQQQTADEDSLLDAAYNLVLLHKYHGLVVTADVINPLTSVLAARGDSRVFNLVDTCTLYCGNRINLDTIEHMFVACRHAGDHHRARSLWQLLSDETPGLRERVSAKALDALQFLQVTGQRPPSLFDKCGTVAAKLEDIPVIPKDGEK